MSLEVQEAPAELAVRRAAVGVLGKAPLSRLPLCRFCCKTRLQRTVKSSRTGEWLFQESLFRKWKAEEIRALWCRGIRAGKTVLASIVVDDLRTNLANDMTGVAVLYLDHKAPAEAHSPRNLLAAIWQQLVVKKPIPSAVHTLYNRHYAQGTCLSLEETYSMLYSAIQGFSGIFIVVDALDEYPEGERDTLLRYLWSLGPAARLLLTSRPHVSCDHVIPDIAIVEIRATEEDIRKYVEGRIEKSPRLSRHIDKSPTLRDSIEENIVKRSDGMFLLAKLHIDSLATKQNVATVKEALTNLSSNLDGTYDDIMKRIHQQSEDDRHLALRTLSWVVHAKTPLRPSQLKEALAVKPGATTLDPDRQTDIDIILSLCAGLVVVEEADDQVRVVHYTTQTYFELAHVQTSLFLRAQSEITLTCITYMSLTFEAFSETLSYPSLLFVDSPFLYYAVEHWFIHAHGGPETDIKHAILSFLDNFLEPWWRSWHWPVDPQSAPNKVQIAMDLNLQVLCRDMINKDGASFLQNAVSRGATDEVRILLEYGINVDKEAGAVLEAVIHGERDILRLLLADSQGRNTAVLQAHGNKECIQVIPVAESKDRYGAALYHASWTGNAEFVQLLLEHGAEVNAGGGEDSALQSASKNGHEAIVKLLLEHGAAVNTQNREYGSVLQAASRKGHEAIVKLLLEHGADVDARGEKGLNALELASDMGHEAIVKLLLDHGAHVNAADGEYRNALQLASNNGHEIVVKLLLEHGAVVNARDGNGWNALEIASDNGDKTVVELLLEHGADVNARDGNGWNALESASDNGHETIVKLLLEHGADVDARDGNGWNALESASHNGHETIVKLLLEHGADVDARGEKGPNALELASEMGHEAIVKLLLEHGADVNARGEKGPNALELASEMGQEAIVKLLLEHGADVNARDGNGWNALELASDNGRKTIVELLLEHGADVNAGGEKGPNALELASEMGQEAIVKLLLEHGAVVNARDGNGWNALELASDNGRKTIVELLLEHGADVNAGGGEDGSALEIAPNEGNEAIAELLVEHGALVDAGGAELTSALDPYTSRTPLAETPKRRLANSDLDSVLESNAPGMKRRRRSTEPSDLS
ncbi:ankyrin repeat-containing domain protein [Mycena rebaudengoi]|nr:ankyrin repeat-containing domain protein [Mycena rebaudengoi]